MNPRRTIQMAIALFPLLALPRLAVADTLTGTIGALGAGLSPNGAHYAWFKFTDAALTKGCTNVSAKVPAEYAYLYLGNGNAPTSTSSKEIYALLLVSKKGAPITCVTGSKTECSVTSCELP